MAVHIGTSGYVYGDWRGVFYPPGLPERSWLARYAESFRTLELNATFYRLSYGSRALSPVADSLRRWSRGGRDAFVYFNNDHGGAALRDALDLRKLVGRHG